MYFGDREVFRDTAEVNNAYLSFPDGCICVASAYIYYNVYIWVKRRHNIYQTDIKVLLCLVILWVYRFCCNFTKESNWKHSSVTYFIKINLNSWTKGYFLPCLAEVGPVVLEKKFFNGNKLLSLFRYHPPWKKSCCLHLN